MLRGYVKKYKCNLFTHRAYKSSLETRSKVTVCSRSNWNLEMLVCGGRKTGVPGEKKTRSKDENQQQTQLHPTYDAESGNRSRATLVGEECSHHCAIPTPLGAHFTRVSILVRHKLVPFFSCSKSVVSTSEGYRRSYFLTRYPSHCFFPRVSVSSMKLNGALLLPLVGWEASPSQGHSKHFYSTLLIYRY